MKSTVDSTTIATSGDRYALVDSAIRQLTEYASLMNDRAPRGGRTTHGRQADRGPFAAPALVSRLVVAALLARGGKVGHARVEKTLKRRSNRRPRRAR
jgi:hypothetical protein